MYFAIGYNNIGETIMTYTKNPNIVEEKISNTELMLFNPNTEEVHVLNETSTEIYILICNCHSLVEVLNQYVNEHIGEMCEDRTITIDELAMDAKSTINLLIANSIIYEGDTNE